MFPNGLVPSLLVFGVLPSIPCPNSKSIDQTEPCNALNPHGREWKQLFPKTKPSRFKIESTAGY